MSRRSHWQGRSRASSFTDRVDWPMPLFFFDIYNRQGLYDKDYHGTSLPDAEAARAEALKVARELSEDWRHEPRDWLDGMTIKIVDEQGQAVLTVPFPNHDAEAF